MQRQIFILGAATALAGCGQSGDDAAANRATTHAAQPRKKPAYCFFKTSETKSWAASRDKDGNIVVHGKAYRKDARYRALLGPPTVAGTTAEIAPTITVNDTGYAAQDDWWDVSAAIPNSAAIDAVTVRCGVKALAEFKVPAKG